MKGKTILVMAALLLSAVQVFGQVDRREVRAGNRKYKKEDFKTAEIEFRKAQAKDSTSFSAAYDLGTTLYRQGEYEDAGKVMDKVKEQAEVSEHADRYFFNQGDVALQKKDYQAAVEAFKQCLLRDPGDLDAKESYIYAKKMLENQNNGGGGGNDQNQNQDQNQNNDQDQNQDQNNDQNQDQNNDQNQNKDQNQGQQPQESKVSPQQAQQMLKAIQAKEKETQDKVNKEKADLLKSKEKEKNW